MRSIEKINALLDKTGMSGAELSIAAGLSNSAYSQWNTGKTKPSRKTLFKVAQVLGVDVSEVLPDPEDSDAPLYPGKIEGEKKPAPLFWGELEKAAFSTAWDEATPEGREIALSVLRLSKRET